MNSRVENYQKIFIYPFSKKKAFLGDNLSAANSTLTKKKMIIKQRIYFVNEGQLRQSLKIFFDKDILTKSWSIDRFVF